VILAALVLVAGLTAAPETGGGPRALADVAFPADALPEGCAVSQDAHAISIQAETLGQVLSDMSLVAKPVATHKQPMRCGKEQGVVFYYQFATEADAVESIAFIRTLVWGEDHPTSMHPELIDRVANVVVVISFSHPAPIEKALEARVTGAGAPGGAATLPPDAKKEFEKGMAAYKKQDYAAAEKSFRSLVASMPDSAFAHLYLGHSIFYQERFSDSIPDYEKARDLGMKSEELELVNRRILNDQLGMAYGLTGRMADAKKHFEAAIARDPDYPFYYYNLACAESETGDLDGALANLKRASEHRANFLPGESLPNPREDDSFKKYVGNPKFEATVKEIGF